MIEDNFSNYFEPVKGSPKYGEKKSDLSFENSKYNSFLCLLTKPYSIIIYARGDFLEKVSNFYKTYNIEKYDDFFGKYTKVILKYNKYLIKFDIFQEKIQNKYKIRLYFDNCLQSLKYFLRLPSLLLRCIFIDANKISNFMALKNYLPLIKYSNFRLNTSIYNLVNRGEFMINNNREKILCGTHDILNNIVIIGHIPELKYGFLANFTEFNLIEDNFNIIFLKLFNRIKYKKKYDINIYLVGGKDNVIDINYILNYLKTEFFNLKFTAADILYPDSDKITFNFKTGELSNKAIIYEVNLLKKMDSSCNKNFKLKKMFTNRL